ncbi:MAG: MFS transporter small subunit [Edaphobacter sp.]
MAESTNVQRSSPLLVVAAWIIVIVPTAWGLNYTVRNAMKLFTSSSSTPATVAPAK